MARALRAVPAVLLPLVLALLSFGAVAAPSSAAPSFAAGTSLDGMRIAHLPDGLGGSTDFRYEYDDVAFVSRVWESRTGTGWRVDLGVDTMRGPRLRTPRALHDWFVAYEDRPAGEATYVPTVIRGRPGWIGADQVFWLLRPGLAVVVDLDTSRWSWRELVRTAWSVRELHARAG